MIDEERPYMTWLLRLWCVEDAGTPLWRASLENARTGERYGFADLDGLLAFISDLTAGHVLKPAPVAKRCRPDF